MELIVPQSCVHSGCRTGEAGRTSRQGLQVPSQLHPVAHRRECSVAATADVVNGEGQIEVDGRPGGWQHLRGRRHSERPHEEAVVSGHCILAMGDKQASLTNGLGDE